MTTYTSNLGLAIMTPGDPAVKNAWGTIQNNSIFNLLDTSIAGYLSKAVAGAANVVLTVVDGAADEARYKMFNLTGILTGNIVVLWPNAKTGIFLVKNSTTGAFTVGLGVNNGAGLPAGTTATIPQGASGVFYSDGTNVSSAVGIGSLGGVLPIANGGTGATTAALARTALSVPDLAGTGAAGTWGISITGGVSTAGNVTCNTVNAVTINASGNITASGNVTAFSDDRLKTAKVEIDGALDKISKIRGFSYAHSEEALALGFPAGRFLGVSAQTVEAVFPEVVFQTKKGDEEYLTVAYDRLVPVLIQAIKELTTKVAELESRAP